MSHAHKNLIRRNWQYLWRGPVWYMNRLTHRMLRNQHERELRAIKRQLPHLNRHGRDQELKRRRTVTVIPGGLVFIGIPMVVPDEIYGEPPAMKILGHYYLKQLAEKEI